jgi:hypothetical protein
MFETCHNVAAYVTQMWLGQNNSNSDYVSPEWICEPRPLQPITCEQEIVFMDLSEVTGHRLGGQVT